MDNFYELSQDAKDKFFEVFNKKSFPIPLKFLFQGDEKQKVLVKVAVIPPKYAFSIEKELLLTINETILDAFDEDSVTILFEQEIDKITMNIETGKIKLCKTDLNTFSSIVNKYGVEKVARANQVEELYQSQQKDAKEDQEFIV
jgi:hypothetical protein